MSSVTMAVDNPPKNNVWEAIFVFLTGRIFAIICFALISISSIVVGSYYGYAKVGPGLSNFIAAGVIFVTLLAIVACHFIARVLRLSNSDSDPLYVIFEKKWGLWIIFGPGFASLFIFSHFAFWSMPQQVVVIDGQEISGIKWAIPYQGNILIISREFPIYIEKASATTKDNVLVRGNVSAEIILGGPTKLWVSDEYLKEKAKENVESRFRAAISTMSVKDLEHPIIIEVNIGKDTDLSAIGLKWKLGSVIEVSKIHAAPPGS